MCVVCAGTVLSPKTTIRRMTNEVDDGMRQQQLIFCLYALCVFIVSNTGVTSMPHEKDEINAAILDPNS